MVVCELHQNDNENDIQAIKQQTDIICPICKEDSILTIKDYIISLNECYNRHKSKNYFLKEFYESQQVNESKILCKKCNKKRTEIYEKKICKCCTCDENLCPICTANHDKNHLIIDYELKNFICNIHNERYISFCKDCHQNLCDLCEIAHTKNHVFIYHKDIIKNEDEIKNNLNNLKINVEKFKNEIYSIINKLNQIINNMELYYKISSNIINNFNTKNKNYQSLTSINNINDNNNAVIEEIKQIIAEKMQIKSL